MSVVSTAEKLSRTRASSHSWTSQTVCFSPQLSYTLQWLAVRLVILGLMVRDGHRLCRRTRAYGAGPARLPPAAQVAAARPRGPRRSGPSTCNRSCCEVSWIRRCRSTPMESIAVLKMEIRFVLDTIGFGQVEVSVPDLSTFPAKMYRKAAITSTQRSCAQVSNKADYGVTPENQPLVHQPGAAFPCLGHSMHPSTKIWQLSRPNPLACTSRSRRFTRICLLSFSLQNLAASAAASFSPPR